MQSTRRKQVCSWEVNDIGEESKQESKLVAIIDGEYHEVKPLDATPLIEAIDKGAEMIDRLKAEIVGNLKTPKYFRCKSRKRFIKLLMANKFSKREAQGMATVAYLAGWTWEEAWWRTWPLLVFR